MSAPQTLPHDLGAERAMVAEALRDAAIVDDVADILEPAHFYSPRLATMWAAVRDVHRRGDPLDMVTIRAELVATGKLDAAGGDEGLLEATDGLLPTGAAEAHARRLVQLASVRAIATACLDVAARAHRPIEDVAAFLDSAEATVHAAAQSRGESRQRSMRDLVASVYESIQARAASGPVRGLPTGIVALDEMISGLQEQQLVIVAGRPGMGKSALAGASAMACASSGPVLVWSGEMSAEAWAERMIVSESGVHGSVVRAGGDSAGGGLSRDQWSAIGDASARIAALPIVVDDTPAISLWQLRSKARRMRARDGLALVVVDYLQLMQSGERHSKREEEVAAVSRGLKALAKELRVPVMALSQLNRRAETTGDKRPGMADLRESGQIEQDADVIAFVFRAGYYDRELPQAEAEVIVAKQRAGATGTVLATFDAALTRWSDRPGEASPRYEAPLPDDFDDEDWR